MDNLTRKTLVFLCVLLLITLAGIAYGLQPRPMWSTEALPPSTQLEITGGPIRHAHLV